jgi:hypothetical protein
MNPKSQKKQKKFEQELGPGLRAFLQHQKINIQLLQIARALVDLMWAVVGTNYHLPMTILGHSVKILGCKLSSYV